MRREYIFIGLTWFFFFLRFENLYVNAEESGDEYAKGCAHLRCESGSQCIKRRFWCKEPPCSGMLYCSKSRKESFKGPLTCDTVRCNKGYICMVKVRECHWDHECKQQIARCVSEKEYYEGAASCAGFKCPSEKRCILRETYCVNPPCKLIKSCAKAEDVQTWFDECRRLNCVSEYECFLRRPENNCLDPGCSHTPDCTLTVEDELISKYCHGWICPRSQRCVVRIVGFCRGFNCTIERSCRANSMTPAVQYHTSRSNEPTLATSTRRSNLCHTTPTKHDTEDPLTRPQAATTGSNPSTKSFESSTSQPDLMLSYPQSWWNDKLSTNTTDVIEITSKLADLSSDTTFPASLPVEKENESTTSRDTKSSEMPKTYIASNDALPMVLEGINFVGQSYPIWIQNDPYHAVSLEIKGEDGETRGYHAPQEPYKILLPPYEPVILVEDTNGRGKFFPFFTYAFDRPFDDAVLISLPEITSIDRTMVASKDDTSTIADDKIDNYTKNSRTVEGEDLETNYFDDTSDYYTNFPTVEDTIPPNIQKKSNDYHDDWPWFIIHDNPEGNEPQSAHKQEFKSSRVDSATDSYRHYTVAETFMKNQIGDGKKSQTSVTQFVNNNNFATPNPSITTGQGDYNSRDEKLYGLANYPYDTISVDDIDKSERENRNKERL